MNIRPVTPEDAAALATIYAPIVLKTAISFEVEAPDASEMRAHIAKTLPTLPWLVSEDSAGAVSGYVYASQHRERAAYQWSVDVTSYVRDDCRGQGIGKRLYAQLLEELVALGYYQAFAGIALPNEASVALHESVGFRPLGVYEKVGFKFDAWRDVGWWQKELRPPAPHPEPPKLLLGAPWILNVLAATTIDPVNSFKSVSYSSGRPGPRLIVLGAVHGNEVCGSLAIGQVMAMFEAGELALVAGQVTFVPVTNPLPYAKKTRAGDRNLNRGLQPTEAPREFEDEVANWLCPLLASHDVLLDLHSFQGGAEPFVFIGPENNQGEIEPFHHAELEEALALRLGVGRCVTGWLSTYAAGVKHRQKAANPIEDANASVRYGIGTTEYMRSVGGWAVTLECGQHDDPLAVDVGRTAILNSLTHLGLLSGARPERVPHMQTLQLCEVVDRHDAGDAFARGRRSFDALQRGEVIATRADGSTVSAPFDGFIVFPNPNASMGTEWFYLAKKTDRLSRAR